MEQPILVKRDGVPLHWHEAVAIVGSVADALVEGRIRAAPPAGELALERDGSVHVSPGAAGHAADPAHAATALRELLRDLLPGDAPAELRALADGQASAPVSSLSDIRDALGFFERPSAAKDRQALAARLGAIREQRQLDEEIERLKHKARADDHQRSDRRGPTGSGVASKVSRKKVVLLAACGAAAGLLLALTLAPVTASRVWSGGTSVAGDMARPAFVEKLRDAAKSALGTGTRDAAAKPSVSESVPRALRASARRSAAGSKHLPLPIDRGVAISPPAPLDLPTVTALPSSIWTPPPELTLPNDFAPIFTAEDAEVHPPVLVRPHLSTVSVVGLPPQLIGSVEVVIGQDGRVEQVRLVATTSERRYYDAMILAAVKAWVFRPAGRSGQPVRYRLRISLT